MKKEIWKNVVWYEGLYKVSNLWRVINIKTKFIFKNIYHKRNWYYYVWLTKNSKQRSHRVHRIIATAFIQNNFDKPCINHIDWNKWNNTIENLEWCTHSENNFHFNKMWNFIFSKKRKEHLDKIREKTLKPVLQYSKENELIWKYISIAEASKKTCIGGRNIQNNASWASKSAWWFIWKYYKDNPKYI